MSVMIYSLYLEVSSEEFEEMKDLFLKIQKEHKGKADGVYDLYNELYLTGRCTSYCKDRIYN